MWEGASMGGVRVWEGVSFGGCECGRGASVGGVQVREGETNKGRDKERYRGETNYTRF